MQMFKNIGNMQESINSLNNKQENTRIELKQDIANVEERLNKKIEETKVELEQKNADVRAELKQDITNVEESFDKKLRENAKETA